MVQKRKKMSVKEFRAKGYLQEVNRLLLHRLGLALEVMVDTESGEERFGEVWDSREDPEGIVFMEYDQVKAKRIALEYELRKDIRAQLPECNKNGLQVREGC